MPRFSPKMYLLPEGIPYWSSIQDHSTSAKLTKRLRAQLKIENLATLNSAQASINWQTRQVQVHFEPHVSNEAMKECTEAIGRIMVEACKQ